VSVVIVLVAIVVVASAVVKVVAGVMIVVVIAAVLVVVVVVVVVVVAIVAVVLDPIVCTFAYILSVLTLQIHFVLFLDDKLNCLNTAKTVPVEYESGLNGFCSEGLVLFSVSFQRLKD
jgi:hypothetical protein